MRQKKGKPAYKLQHQYVYFEHFFLEIKYNDINYGACLIYLKQCMKYFTAARLPEVSCRLKEKAVQSPSCHYKLKSESLTKAKTQDVQL